MIMSVKNVMDAYGAVFFYFYVGFFVESYYCV